MSSTAPHTAGGTVLGVNLNPAANDPAASTTALDPVTLIAATKMRYQWADTTLVGNIVRPSRPADGEPDLDPVDRVSGWRGWSVGELALAGLALAGCVAMLLGGGDARISGTGVVVLALAAISFSILADANTSRILAARSAAAGPELEVPANVRDAWNRVHTVTATYAHSRNAVASGSLLELENGSWMAVEEIAAHVKAGTTARPECVAAMDALFHAAAQADTYDLLRKHATEQQPAHSPAAALLSGSDIDGALALLAPAPAEAPPIAYRG